LVGARAAAWAQPGFVGAACGILLGAHSMKGVVGAASWWVSGAACSAPVRRCGCCALAHEQYAAVVSWHPGLIAAGCGNHTMLRRSRDTYGIHYTASSQLRLSAIPPCSCTAPRTAAIMQLHPGWVGVIQSRYLNALGCLWFNRTQVSTCVCVCVVLCVCVCVCYVCAIDMLFPLHGTP
jgi:hypothetical protein